MGAIKIFGVKQLLSYFPKNNSKLLFLLPQPSAPLPLKKELSFFVCLRSE